MVNLNENDASNNPKINKRQSNDGENGSPAKFRKSGNFGDRSPFNRGNRPPFNRENNFNRDNGRPFNRDNKPPFNRGNKPPFNKGNRSFDRQGNGAGNYNNRDSFRGQNNFQNRNSGGRPGFNQKFNKPWQQGNTLFQSNDNENSPIKHKKFDDVEAEVNEVKNDNSIKNKNKVEDEQVVDTPNSNEDESESSESEDEVETQTSNMQDESETSDSEDEDQPITNNKANVKTSKTNVNASKNELESSSSEDETENTQDSAVNETNVVVTEQPNGGTNVTNTPLNEDPIARRERESRSIFVKGIPVTVKEDVLQQFFSRYGKIKSMRWHGFTNFVKPGAKCSIQFENVEDAHKSLEVNGMEYKGHYLQVQMFGSYDSLKKSDNEVYLANVPENVDINLLWRAFEFCGVVNEIRIAGASHCAFVVFDSADSVELALDMKKITIENREIVIKPVLSFEERKNKIHSPGGFTKRRAGPKIYVQPNKFNKNSITITLDNGNKFGSPNFGRRPQGRKVQTGFVSKNR